MGTGANSNYEVDVCKHLIHYGIAAVLIAQVKLRLDKTTFCKTNDESHVGQRVAKVFDIEADDGDNIYRGTVRKVIEVEGGGKEFRIQYDDGDSEDVTMEDLYSEFFVS